ncbi:IS91 family transposase, partial [Saccharicrinis sp. 156]|uniref:IS91 family transposase n=1 Tax=Saccharicrinis sp. 156 TaxID=3417574 RepID=UPI003D341462
DFLFDVRQMSDKFSASFAGKLRKLKQDGKINKTVPRDLIPKPWVVYAKRAFGSPQSIIEYLGRYSHRVAISNARILKVTDTHVTFKWCNRKENYRQETQTVTGVEFLKRFLEHIVPPYFRRIRHLGFLSARNKTKCLQSLRDDLNVKHRALKPTRSEVLLLRFGERSLLQCKHCNGELRLVETYARQRAPPDHQT